jgi:predicted cupin superfamily sugar epimerase
MNAGDIISILGLRPLAGEGGFFCETYRSDETWSALPARYRGESRALATTIYYLLSRDTFSAMHRLATDEVYHFYLGDPVEMLQLFDDGSGSVTRIGTNLRAGARPQVVVPKGAWQGSSLAPGGEFALLGTSMAPGFEFADFELGRRDELRGRYPQYQRLVDRLTRD